MVYLLRIIWIYIWIYIAMRDMNARQQPAPGIRRNKQDL